MAPPDGPRIDVPVGLGVSPQWGLNRLPHHGRLAWMVRIYSDGDAYNFPVHPGLNQLSQVMQIDFDELLAGYGSIGDFSCVSGFLMLSVPRWVADKKM